MTRHLRGNEPARLRAAVEAWFSAEHPDRDREAIDDMAYGCLSHVIASRLTEDELADLIRDFQDKALEARVNGKAIA